MSHFGLLCPAASGHRVTLVGIADAGAAAAAAGAGFQTIGRADHPLGASRATLEAIGERNGLEALRAAGVQMLLIVQASFAGPTVAEQLALPFVTVSSALLLNREPGCATAAATPCSTT